MNSDLSSAVEGDVTPNSLGVSYCPKGACSVYDWLFIKQ